MSMQQMLLGVAPPGPSGSVSVLSVTGAVEATDVTSFSFTLPVVINAGELLVIAIATGKAGAPVATISTPSGWTSIYSNTANTGRQMALFYKYAAGTEGGTNVSFTLSQLACVVCQCWQMSGASGAPAFAADADGGWGTAPNPPNLVSGKTGTILWIAGVIGSTDTGPTSWPTGFTDNRTATTVTSANPQQVSMCSMFSTATTVNPAAFTMPASLSGRPFTMAVGA